MDECRLDHLAQIAAWYFEENLGPLSPLRMAQCFSNALVSRGPRCLQPYLHHGTHVGVGWGTAVYQVVRAMISLSLGDAPVTGAETASSALAWPKDGVASRVSSAVRTRVRVCLLQAKGCCRSDKQRLSRPFGCHIFGPVG